MLKNAAIVPYIGSRFTQVGDQELGRLNLLSFGATTIGAPLTAAVFTYNPELPAYDLLNLRAGVRGEHLSSTSAFRQALNLSPDPP